MNATKGAIEPVSELSANQFGFGGAVFDVVGEAALFWRAHDILIVSDLHLEKASSYAVRGQMLPPYDSLSTLEMLSVLAQTWGARGVLCLGDNFHDDAGEARLQGDAAKLLRALTTRYDWTWIVGNHDPGIGAAWGGRVVAERQIAGIMFRHEVEAGWSGPEISGHYHPKMRITARGRNIARRAFVRSNNKLIMPAFGALTGGMDAGDPVILAALGQAGVQALVPTSGRLTRFALG